MVSQFFGDSKQFQTYSSEFTPDSRQQTFPNFCLNDPNHTLFIMIFVVVHP